MFPNVGTYLPNGVPPNYRVCRIGIVKRQAEQLGNSLHSHTRLLVGEDPDILLDKCVENRPCVRVFVCSCDKILDYAFGSFCNFSVF